MKTIEQQKRALTRVIRQLEIELESMKAAEDERSWVYVDADSGKRVHYDRFEAKPIW